MNRGFDMNNLDLLSPEYGNSALTGNPRPSVIDRTHTVGENNSMLGGHFNVARTQELFLSWTAPGNTLAHSQAAYLEGIKMLYRIEGILLPQYRE